MCFFHEKEERTAIMSFSFPGAVLASTDANIPRFVPDVEKPVVYNSAYQSSSNRAESPSASSTHDGSYFVFFICALQAGQTWTGFETEAPQAEQTNSSALKR
jgi:hypothetical protein